MAESSKQSTKTRKTARQKAVEKNSREIAELTKKHGVNNGRQSMEGDIARERRLRGGDKRKKAQIKILNVSTRT